MNSVKSLFLMAVLSSTALASPFVGTYVGGQAGASKAPSRKSAYGSVNIPGLLVGSGSLNEEEDSYNQDSKWAFSGGILGGYREKVRDNFVLGWSLGANLENNESVESVSGTAITKATRDYSVDLLGQVGYLVQKDLMPYIVGGLSFSSLKLSTTLLGQKSEWNSKVCGYSFGAGLAYAVNDKVSANLQYLYTGYPSRTHKFTLASGANSVSLTNHGPEKFHALTFGLQIKI